MALQIIEDEKCPKCGVPVYWAYSEDNAITFKMDHIDCFACAHREREEKDRPKNYKQTPGRTEFVKAVPEEGFELPSRTDFIEQQIAKATKA